jgi:hypothetical protein
MAVCALLYAVVQQRLRYKLRDSNKILAKKLLGKDGLPNFEVARQLLGYLFQYEDNFIALMALRVGILRTFAIPTTARVLVKSGNFACTARKYSLIFL